MRIPLTLWRYTLLDLARVVVLSGSVLVIVIAFAATVRYTAEGRLGPLETLKFMLYAIPPMLQYALPFAAGFGATLAYHRMTQDNELIAAAAGGVSHIRFLMPAAIMGTLIAAFLWYLSGQVIPSYLRDMERLVTADATKVLMKSIQSGKSVPFGSKLLSARSVYALGPNKETGSTDELVLTGVALVDLDKSGRVEREVFTRQARLSFFSSSQEQDSSSHRRRAPSSFVVMDIEEGMAKFAEGRQGTTRKSRVIQPLPGGVKDDPKYLTNDELARLPSDPDQINTIEAHGSELAVHIAERRANEMINRDIAKSRSFRLRDSEDRIYVIRVVRMQYSEKDKRWQFFPAIAGRDIEIDRYPARPDGEPDTAAGTRFSARTAGLVSDLGQEFGYRRLTFTLKMENVSGLATGASADQREAAGVLNELSYTGLEYANVVVEDLMDKSSLELARMVREGGLDKDPFIRGPFEELVKRLERLRRDVLGKQHERLANSAACLVMVLAGAVTALRLGSRLPLTVYLWSFFPALVAVLTISTGQQTTRNLGVGGLFILWGGVTMLAAYTAAAYWMVRRH